MVLERLADELGFKAGNGDNDRSTCPRYFMWPFRQDFEWEW